jgi:xylose dehydrogenase (NAD/NADP)
MRRIDEYVPVRPGEYLAAVPSRIGRRAMNNLRWGVISTSNIGRAAVNPAIRASKNGELLAVASRDVARARAFAEEWSIPRHFGSYDALLDDPDIDAVYLPLPNSMHLEWAVRAAEAGKHVLCEKPLALDAEECLRMEAAAEAAGVRLMEAFMYRFHPRTQRVLERLQEGAVGELLMMRSSFTFRLTRPDNIRWDPTLGGGALMDVGCYCVNISRTMAGAEPVEVQATANWSDRGVDRELVGMLRFPGDVLAHFDCALTLERTEAYEVSGTDGTLQVPSAFLPGTGDVPIHLHRGREGTETEVVVGVDEYRLMVEHFADGVLNGTPFRYPAAEAARNMRAIEALYRSARDGGRPVTVEATVRKS